MRKHWCRAWRLQANRLACSSCANCHLVVEYLRAMRKHVVLRRACPSRRGPSRFQHGSMGRSDRLETMESFRLEVATQQWCLQSLQVHR